jgi:hypothetical protein
VRGWVPFSTETDWEELLASLRETEFFQKAGMYWNLIVRVLANMGALQCVVNTLIFVDDKPTNN